MNMPKSINCSEQSGSCVRAEWQSSPSIVCEGMLRDPRRGTSRVVKGHFKDGEGALSHR